MADVPDLSRMRTDYGRGRLDEEIVLYCGGGFRSALAAEALQQMGYRNVWSMAGGWKAWLAAGLPTER